MFTYLKQQTHWLGQQDNELFFFFFGKMVDCCCKYSRERTCKNPSNISRALPMVCPHVVQFYGPFLLFLGYFVPELLPFDDWYIINPGCFVILLLSIAISVLYSSCVLQFIIIACLDIGTRKRKRLVVIFKRGFTITIDNHVSNITGLYIHFIS